MTGPYDVAIAGVVVKQTLTFDQAVAWATGLHADSPARPTVYVYDSLDCWPVHVVRQTQPERRLTPEGAT